MTSKSQSGNPIQQILSLILKAPCGELCQANFPDDSRILSLRVLEANQVSKLLSYLTILQHRFFSR